PVCHLGEVELLVEAIVGIEPAHVRRRERDVAFGIALGKLLFVQPIDRAAGDVLDRNARRGGKFLADEVVDHVPPATPPHADDELVLSARLRRRQECRQDESQRSECHADPFHAPAFPIRSTIHLTPRAVAKASSNTRGFPARHYSLRAPSLSSVAGSPSPPLAAWPRKAWFTLKLESRLTAQRGSASRWDRAWSAATDRNRG